MHTTRTSQIPGDQEEIEQGENNVNRPGCLLDYNTVYKPSMISWGKRVDGSAIFIPTSIITDAYNEIATWRKNIFLLPYGKVGRDFIDQITLHINGWNSGSDNPHIYLKAAFVLLPLGLQKLNAKSKAKDHQDVLSMRFTHWRQVEINKLLRERRIIQGRIGKLKASDPPDRSKVFAKEENVREVFKETSINVTVQGQKHLGAVIGSREYLEEYVSEKVYNWVNEVATLAEFALS